jgi:hypothetical protein
MPGILVGTVFIVAPARSSCPSHRKFGKRHAKDRMTNI